MRILAINAGSSSLKFRLFELGAEENLIVSGSVTEFGAHARYEANHGGQRIAETLTAADHAAAAREMLNSLKRCGVLSNLTGIGHRVVHGGGRFAAPIRVTDEILSELIDVSSLAPLHNPPALAAMAVCRDLALPTVAVFDTAFFHDLPAHVQMYGLPTAWRRGIRRFGFHGLAHRYLSERCREQSGARRMVTLQLGNGCSIAAIENGRPVETSMGYTPLEGLIMATRGGDIDPGVLLQLTKRGLSTSELDDGLNQRAGLLGLSDASGDMRELLELEQRGHPGAKLAIAAFCHRARKYLGAYAAVLGGLDAVVFGGGIGEHAPAVRARICAKLEWCELEFDAEANAAGVGKETRISKQHSRVAVFVIPVNEELVIARETRKTLLA